MGSPELLFRNDVTKSYRWKNPNRLPAEKFSSTTIVPEVRLSNVPIHKGVGKPTRNTLFATRRCVEG